MVAPLAVVVIRKVEAGKVVCWVCVIVDANCVETTVWVVVCWITLVKIMVDPLAVVVMSKVEAGKVVCCVCVIVDANCVETTVESWVVVC